MKMIKVTHPWFEQPVLINPVLCNDPKELAMHHLPTEEDFTLLVFEEVEI